jgi:anaerobic selenocysteine-containing dehydrogenase
VQKGSGKWPGEETGNEVRKTLCDICNPHSHCGIDAYVKDGVVVRVEGSKDHLHSQGTLCSKGSASRQYLYHKDRIRTPLVRRGERGSDNFEPVSWDEAPDSIADRLLRIKAELLIRAARLYATTSPAAMMTSASPTVHHTNGVQNHRALIALVGLTGNFDEPGGNYVLPPSWLNIPAAPRVRELEFVQSRPWEEMAPRLGQDAYPVWRRLVDQAQAMHLPFQIRSGKPNPIRALLGFGMRYRMWPGADVNQLIDPDYLDPISGFPGFKSLLCEVSCH